MISDNLRNIRQEVQRSCALVGRDPNSVTIVAVTKTIDAAATQKVVDAGLFHLAENRADKFLLKKQELADYPQVVWHFIGNLQRRKVKLIINEIDYFHALDNLKLAAEIQKRRETVLPCFIEVNVSGEASKHGVHPADLLDFVKALETYDRIQIVGLMTMAPLTEGEALLHGTFKQLRLLRDAVQELALSFAPCTELSMGMSNDFPIAIQEGATFIRIGTALVKDV